MKKLQIQRENDRKLLSHKKFCAFSTFRIPIFVSKIISERQTDLSVKEKLFDLFQVMVESV